MAVQVLERELVVQAVLILPPELAPAELAMARVQVRDLVEAVLQRELARLRLAQAMRGQARRIPALDLVQLL